MTTAILVLVGAPFGLAVLLALLGVLTSARADPANRRDRGESARQREIIERALELRGVVPPQPWPWEASKPATPARRSRRETPAVPIR